MTDEEPKLTSEEHQLTGPAFINWVIPEDGVPEVYSDWYYVNWLPLTVRIRFGQIVANPKVSPGHKDSAWVIAERMALTMPWHAIKQLAIMLTSLVEKYEKENGELTLPNIPALE
jgi:hypothetical protein